MVLTSESMVISGQILEKGTLTLVNNDLAKFAIYSL